MTITKRKKLISNYVPIKIYNNRKKSLNGTFWILFNVLFTDMGKLCIFPKIFIFMLLWLM